MKSLVIVLLTACVVMAGKIDTVTVVNCKCDTLKIVRTYKEVLDTQDTLKADKPKVEVKPAAKKTDK